MWDLQNLHKCRDALAAVEAEAGDGHIGSDYRQVYFDEKLHDCRALEVVQGRHERIGMKDTEVWRTPWCERERVGCLFAPFAWHEFIDDGASSEMGYRYPQ